MSPCAAPPVPADSLCVSIPSRGSGGVSSSEDVISVKGACVTCASGVSVVDKFVKSGCRCSSCGVLRLLERVLPGFPMSDSYRLPA
eukprot:1684187-Pleurochrysis_carterae.AAC.1